jgi:hypothetical protein
MKVMIPPAPAAPIRAAAPGTPPSATPDPNLRAQEVGVYGKDGSAFMRVEGETLSQAKGGGRPGSTFT